MKIKYYCENNYEVVEGQCMLSEIVSDGRTATLTYHFIDLEGE